MNPALANMFPGMQFIPLIGIGIAVFVLAAFTLIARAFTRKMFYHDPKLGWAMSALIGATPIIGFMIWTTHYVSPLKLPAGAKDVKISRALPFSLAIDDNLRFRISPPEFRSWITSLCGLPWESIQTNSGVIEFEAFRDGLYSTTALAPMGHSHMGKPFDQSFGSAVWMNTSKAKNGYFIPRCRGFYGKILYDADAELVYYSFWD